MASRLTLAVALVAMVAVNVASAYGPYGWEGQYLDVLLWNKGLVV